MAKPAILKFLNPEVFKEANNKGIHAVYVNTEMPNIEKEAKERQAQMEAEQKRREEEAKESLKQQKQRELEGAKHDAEQKRNEVENKKNENGD